MHPAERIVGFEPVALQGWRILRFTSFRQDSPLHPPFETVPLAGWLIIEWIGDNAQPSDRRRNVAPAYMDNELGGIQPVDDLFGSWRVLGPDESEPTEAQAKAAYEEMQPGHKEIEATWDD